MAIHYGFELFGFEPQPDGGGKSTEDQTFFKLNYTTYLNAGCLIATGFFIWLSKQSDTISEMEMDDKDWVETVLFLSSMLSAVWLLVGLGIKIFLIKL